MNIISRIRSTLAKVVRSLSTRTTSVLKSLKKAPSHLSDRLLSDAIRIAEIPSPTTREEQRAEFVLGRLSSLQLTTRVDEDGNILVRIPSKKPNDGSPILLFTDLSSSRWHPLESLSRLDSAQAYGAGLADALGVSALLSIAESMLAGNISSSRDLVLLFATRPLDNPQSSAFKQIIDDPHNRPIAALGIRGITLGTISPRPLGTYRIEVKVRTDTSATDGSQGSAVEVIVALARALSSVTWDTENMTNCRIRRIEAGTGFGRNPTEGLLDIEMESSNGPVLDLAMKAAIATAEAKGREAKAQLTVEVVGFVPVGDPKVGTDLIKLISRALKDQHIVITEDNSADPASAISSQGIPAASIAIATGYEGLSQDKIEIASIERGRKLLVAIIERIASESA